MNVAVINFSEKHEKIYRYYVQWDLIVWRALHSYRKIHVQNFSTVWLLFVTMCRVFIIYLHRHRFFFLCKMNAYVVQDANLGKKYSNTLLEFSLCSSTDLFTDWNMFKCLVTSKCLKSQMKSFQVFFFFKKNLKLIVFENFVNLNSSVVVGNRLARLLV